MKRFHPFVFFVFLSSLTAFGVPGSGAAADWVPLSGSWTRSGDRMSEYSDGVASDGRPLWTVSSGGGNPGRITAELRTRDGAGSALMALRWRNRDNYYALRYSDPHRVLELVKMVNGRESVLASKENAVPSSPKDKPLLLTLEIRGAELSATAGKTVLRAHADNFPTGAAALGCSFRQVEFSKIEFQFPEQTVAFPGGVIPLFRDRVFLREKIRYPLSFRIENRTRELWRNAEFQLLPAPGVPMETHRIGELAPGRSVNVLIPFSGEMLKSGDYRASYRLVSSEKALLASGEFDYSVAEPLRKDRFEMILWDMIPSGRELAERGFTAGSVSFFNAAKYTKDRTHLRETDDALRNAADYLKYGVSTLLKIDTRRNWDKTASADRMIRENNGNIQLHGELCPNHPGYRADVRRALEHLGRTLAGNRSVRYLLFDSETENEERKLYPCAHPECRSAASSAGFSSMPAHLLRRWGMVGVSLGPVAKKSGAPVLKNGTHELDLIKWWWLSGSGFVRHRAESAAILKKALPEARTFHDPILRNPPFRGRDRGMDFVSHWTYLNPSPLSILENIDEMRPAAENPSGAVPNIQLFHYSSEVVGKSAAPSPGDRETDAFVEARDAVHTGRFVTVAPDLLRESIWLAMSRPISAIMFDGGSAVSDLPGTYANTNPDAAAVLTSLSRELIVPYGPMFRFMLRSPRRTAVLQSAVSTLYGRTGNYGNADKTFADAYNVLLLAQLQPEIVYDEDLHSSLDSFDLLVLADTNVLREKEFEAIRAFSEKPGKLLLVDRKSPLKFPKAVAVDFPDTGKMLASLQQKSWIRAGAVLKKQLSLLGWKNDFSAASDSVILSRRMGEGDGALFIVNDLRVPGGYLGKYGKLLDEGVPQRTLVTFPAETMRAGRVLYDVAARRPVKTNPYEVYLPPCGGKWFYAASSEITGLEVRTDLSEVRPGQTLSIRIQLKSAGKLAGSQAIRLTVRDSAGRINTVSGCYAARSGSLSIPLIPAANDRSGYWRIEAEDLIAGHRAEHSFRLLPAARSARK